MKPRLAESYEGSKRIKLVASRFQRMGRYTLIICLHYGIIIFSSWRTSIMIIMSQTGTQNMHNAEETSLKDFEVHLSPS